MVVLVDVEGGAILRQQGLLMGLQAAALGFAELQHLFVFQALQLGIEYADGIGTLLGITAVEGGHWRSLRQLAGAGE